ncbi:MAG: tetratricopeptide repeat protein [Gemmatimonadota bacterium]|nr:tetratricopeptide repeat protein [Gemmatimonadota bacterium]
MRTCPSHAARRVAIAMLALAALIGAAPLAGQSDADVAWREGDIERAEALYEAEVSQGSPSPIALHRLALIRAWSERYHESLELFDRLLVAAPTSVDASLDRAKVLSWRNDLQGAVDAYAGVLVASPENREARLGLARVLSWAGRLDAAERVYHDMLSRDPHDAEALAGYARMAGWDGRLAEAERRWRNGLESHPDDVVLLTGLGATLRWRGRPGAAAEVLERAVGLAPEDEEARAEYRLARLATSPRIGPSLTYESDSDGNRMTTLYHDQSAWLSGDLAINTNGYARDARSMPSGETGQAYGAMIELRWRTGPGWEIHGGGGVTYSTLAEEGVRPQWRLRVATPSVLPAQGWARVSSRALDETAPLMRNGIDLLETSAGLRAAFLGFRGEASIGVTDFYGSETNRRTAGLIALTRRLGVDWNVGVVARALTFEKQLTDGYFDPDFYGLLEARVAWEGSFSGWHIQANASPGIQQVNSGGEISGAIRTRLSFGYEFGPGQVAWIHAGYSTTGLTSFSTGAADYQYFHTAFSVGWAF